MFLIRLIYRVRIQTGDESQSIVMHERLRGEVVKMCIRAILPTILLAVLKCVVTALVSIVRVV